MELPTKTACRIASFCNDTSIEDESRWDDYQDWLIKRLVAMEKVFSWLTDTSHPRESRDSQLQRLPVS
jgi:hypothetical protein